MALSITELKKGTLLQLAGEPFKVVDYKQKVVGRGGSIVNVRVKSLTNGKVLDKTFKGSEQLDQAEVQSSPVQYLYHDNQHYFFMSEETFEQYEIPLDLIADSANYLKEGDKVQLQIYNGRPINVELPKNISLKVTYTEAAVKGDTSAAITKEATTETGLVIKVPAFINTGDIISVDTATGNYRERIKS
jgi:elongation factor P